MTTIATDGKTMASDSRMTSHGEIISDDCPKLFRTKDGSVFGTAGCGIAGELIRQHLMGENEEPTFPSKCEVECLIIKDGKTYWMDENLVRIPYQSPMAIGSGGGFAIGAMLFGASPSEAMEIAIQRDSGSGGAVQELEFTPIKIPLAQ